MSDTTYSDEPADGAPDDNESDDYVYLPPESSLARRILWVVGGIVLFFALLFAIGGWWVMKQVNPSGTGEAISVTVPPGSTTAQIANLLERDGVITNATVFQYYVKWQDAGPFEAGIYDQLHKRSSMNDVVHRLEAGPLPPKYTELVIPEGMWLKDISAKILQTFPQMNAQELDVALSTVRSKYQPEDSTNLEGLLFPATYRVEEGDELDEQKLVRQMTEKFDATADEVNLSDTSTASAVAGRQLSPYEVVIVASMIEKEAKVPEERAMIAQVIYNRLDQGMNLGIDATVLYAIGEQKEQLTQSDLRVDSPYNTRRYPGLPPTPIASPGRDSLEAALHPADGSVAVLRDPGRSGPPLLHRQLLGVRSGAPTCPAGGVALSGPATPRTRWGPSGHTRVGAVIGDPVRHSLSPVIYNAAFAESGADWVFVAFEVAEGGAAAAVDAMRALDLGWFSVTMPHKTAVARCVDRLSDDAAALDAVNCVVNEDGVLVGESTDGEGFVRALAHETGFEPAERRCVVVGAGGAARAVVLALARAGAGDVVVVNRNAERAETAAALAGAVGRVGSEADAAGADLVVNATPVGMAGSGALPLDVAPFDGGAVVADLVYEPEVTPLVAAARARGLTAVNGLGMLVHQAALQLERVIGGPAPLEAMAAAARRGLTER